MKMKDLSPLQKKTLPQVYAFVLPTVLIFLFFYLKPIIDVVWTSFTKWDGFNAPKFIGVTNYVKLFGRENFQYSMRNLLAWGVIAMTLHVAVGAVVAYLFYDNFKGWKFVRAVYMVPNVISVAAWAMIYKFIFNDEYGVLNSAIRTIFPNFHLDWFYSSPAAFWAVTFTWLFYAVIVTLIVLGDLMAIPEELHEAATIYGATKWQVVFNIDLPLYRNALGTAVICSGTSRISMYEAIALTTRGGPGNDTMNLPVLLVNNINDMNYGMANAIGTIMFIIGILLLFIINRAFRMNDPVY